MENYDPAKLAAAANNFLDTETTENDFPAILPSMQRMLTHQHTLTR